MSQEVKGFTLDKPHSWHNPFEVMGYPIRDINLFKDGQVKASFRWFDVKEETRNDGTKFLYNWGNNVVKEKALFVPVELTSIHKRNIDLNSKTAFMSRMTSDRMRFDKIVYGDNAHDLYIPLDALNCEIKRDYEIKDYSLYTMYFDLYWFPEWGIGVRVKTRDVPNKGNEDFVKSIKPLYDLIAIHGFNETHTAGNREEITKLIKELAEIL